VVGQQILFGLIPSFIADLYPIFIEPTFQPRLAPDIWVQL